MKRLLFLLMICLVSVFPFIACEKGTDTGDPGTEEDGSDNTDEKISDATQEVTEKPKETLIMELEGGTAADAGQAGGPLRPLPGKEFLLSRQDDRVISGEDLVIGRLQSVYHAEQEILDIYSIIKQFLDALTQARVAEEISHPDWTQTLQRSIWYHIERGNIPQDFRIGEVYTEDNTGWADIRLIAPVGRAAGEIYVSLLDEKWLITDLQVDLAELNRPYEKNGPYEPNVYRWIHQ